MHSICVPGSTFHTYVDVTSVIYIKRQCNKGVKESIITLSHHPYLGVLNSILSEYIRNILGNLPQEDDQSIALDSVLVNIFIKVFLINF
jgi:ABC-type antimicrobial peptide transport system ATPase subunit